MVREDGSEDFSGRGNTQYATDLGPGEAGPPPPPNGLDPATAQALVDAAPKKERTFMEKLADKVFGASVPGQQRELGLGAELGIPEQQAQQLGGGPPALPPPQQMAPVDVPAGGGPAPGPAPGQGGPPALPPPPNPGPAVSSGGGGGGPGYNKLDESPEAAKRRLGILPPNETGLELQAEREVLANQATQAHAQESGELAAHRELQATQNESAIEEVRQLRAEQQQAINQVLKAKQQRMADLEKQSQIDPDAFWSNNLAGAAFSRIGAAIAMGLSAYGGTGDLTYKLIKDGIDRNIDAQKTRLQAKIQLADKYDALDVFKINSYKERLNALEEYRVAQYNAAGDRIKNISAGYADSDKTRQLQGVENQLRQDAVNAYQKDESRTVAEVQKTVEENQKRRIAAQQAAAARALAEKHRQEDFAHKVLLQQMKGADARAIAGVRQGNLQTDHIARAMDKLTPLRSSVENVSGLLEKGQTVPDWRAALNGRGYTLLSESFATPEEKNLMRGINDEVTLIAHSRFGAQQSVHEQESLRKASSGAQLNYDDMLNIHRLSERVLRYEMIAAKAYGSESAQKQYDANEQVAKDSLKDDGDQ